MSKSLLNTQQWCMQITHSPKLPTIANNMHQAYEHINKVLNQSTPRELGAYDNMPKYRCHSIIHVNDRRFSLRQKFETYRFLNEVNDWNGQPLPDYR